MENSDLIEAAQEGLCHRAAKLGQTAPTPAAFLEKMATVVAVIDSLIAPTLPPIWLPGMDDESGS